MGAATLQYERLDILTQYRERNTATLTYVLSATRQYNQQLSSIAVLQLKNSDGGLSEDEGMDDGFVTARAVRRNRLG